MLSSMKNLIASLCSLPWPAIQYSDRRKAGARSEEVPKRNWIDVANQMVFKIRWSILTNICVNVTFVKHDLEWLSFSGRRWREEICFKEFPSQQRNDREVIPQRSQRIDYIESFVRCSNCRLCLASAFSGSENCDRIDGIWLIEITKGQKKNL
jgi:hypothetical protein